MTESRIAGDRRNLSPAMQALLKKRIRGQIPGRLSASKIPRRVDRRQAPLSLTQEARWPLGKHGCAGSNSNLLQTVRFQEKVDHAILELCVAEIVRRHDVLSTTFHVI